MNEKKTQPRVKKKKERRGAHWNSRMLDQNWGRLSVTQSIWILAVDPAFALHWIYTTSEEERETVLLPDLWIPPPPSTPHQFCVHQSADLVSACRCCRGYLSHYPPWYILFTPHGEIKCISNWLSNKN